VIVGIGIDIVEIERVRAVLDRQKDRFLRRVFTMDEQEYCSKHRDPVPHYAVRFAAKESLFKALGTGWSGGVSWLEVEVSRKGGGAPTLSLSGIAGNVARELGAKIIHLSLSHSEQNAVAFVILEK
jgi:holo-[acyl-carrier protein] synthase